MAKVPKEAGPRFHELMATARRDVSATRAVVALARTDEALTRSMEDALGPTGVTGPRFNVLMELAAAPTGALPLSEVARRLLRSPPNMTTLIDRLEADGHVRRRRGAKDRRVVTAEITEAGWQALARAAPVVFELEKRLLSCLSRGERRDLVHVLERVAKEATVARRSKDGDREIRST